MRVFDVCFVLISLTLFYASASQAAEVDDFIYWRTAELVDERCHYLKGVERQALDNVINETLRTIPQHQRYLSSSMDPDDYQAWIEAVHRRADTAATDLGCTAEAEPYLLAARGSASQSIFQHLLIAFHYNGLPIEDPQRLSIPTDQMQAATGYADFLQKVYGSNFEAFAASQREAATQRLPQAQSTGFGDFYDPLGFGVDPLGLGLPPDTGEDLSSVLWDLQISSHKTLREVHFEVSAEIAGYRVWPETFSNTELPALHPGNSTENSGVVVAGPTEFPVDTGEKLNAVLVRMIGGDLWLMSYGDTARALAAKPAKLALLVRTSALPEGKSPGGAWSSKDWRELATSYELSLVSADCLGGPCWSVPDEGKAAILGNSATEYAEIWISTDPGAKPDMQSEAYRRGGIFAGPIFAAEGDRPFD